MLILAGVSINAVVGDNGIITKAQDSVYLQSIAALQEYLQMEYSNYALEDNPYGTEYGLLKTKNPGWFYQNAQGYILDSEGHVLYLINKSGLPEDIRSQIKGGDASKVSQYYRQQDVYGVTSDLQVYYCKNGTSSIMGLTVDDLQKDNPLEIAYDENTLLAQVVNNGEALSTQALKSIKTLTIDTTEKLELLETFKDLVSLQKVYFSDITIPNLSGIQYGSNIVEVRFTNCTVQDYSALCGLTKLNKLYLITPAGKNEDVAILCSSDKGIASAEFSNLEYFGIVGNGTYLQSTSKDYTGTRYDITDVSGLANLSATTKQSIKYMYLQNLQLTNIASLADFVNVTILRCEENALTTFDGIQNMSKLTYLIAPTCRLDSKEIYTLGNSETDTKNENTDALSYIYKDVNGNNENLYYLDIRNARNLKWTSYLSTCTKIRYLYMDNNTAVKDLTQIANVIGNCGTNYTISGTMTPEIIANNSVKLDLSGATIRESDFRKLKNNTDLKYLSLKNTEIVSDSNTAIANSDYTNLLNEVLSTCSSMIALQLYGQSKLENIHFVSNMNGLRELDLHGCSNVNDVSVLETMTNNGLRLGNLIINNSNVNLTTIQQTISNIYNNAYGYWYGSGLCGLLLENALLMQQLGNCLNITSLYMSRGWNNGSPGVYSTSVNLTGCTSLKNMYIYAIPTTFILPNSLENLSISYGSAVCDLSNCSNLVNISIPDQMNYSAIKQLIESLPDNITTIENFSIASKSTTIENLDFLSKFSNCTNFNKFSLSEVNDWKSFIINDISGLSYLTYARAIGISLASNNPSVLNLPNLSHLVNLSEFYISSGNVTDISNVSTYSRLTKLTIRGELIKNVNALSNLISLTTLTLDNNKLTDISGLSGLTNLTSLNLSSNNINDIKPLENLKKLETLNLQSNALYDSSYDKLGSAYYTLTVFADLNQKQEGSLKNLYLSGNNIEDFSMLQDSNLKWDAKSGW